MALFLLGFQDYAGRVRVALIPAETVSVEDARLLKLRETVSFWGRGPAMKVDGEHPQSDWGRCLEKYCRLLEVERESLVMTLDPNLNGSGVDPDWWQRALDMTRDKNVVDHACITFVSVAEPKMHQ